MYFSFLNIHTSVEAHNARSIHGGRCSLHFIFFFFGGMLHSDSYWRRQCPAVLKERFKMLKENEEKKHLVDEQIESFRGWPPAEFYFRH